MDANRLIAIDGWRIDASRYRSLRHGIDKKLETRSMGLLLNLVGTQIGLFPAKRFEDNLWQGRVVDYDALCGTIVRIRKAIELASN